MMLSLMRGITLTIALLVGMAATAIAQENTAGRIPLGTVGRVQGEAFAAYSLGGRVLTQGATVYQDDTLSTGDNSRLLVHFADASDLTLGSNAAIVILDLIAAPAVLTPRVSEAVPGTRDVMSLIRGVFSLTASPTPGAQITTPVATIGIRGTQLWGGPLTGALDVLLFEGKIDVITPAGTLTLDQPGQGTVITAAGQGASPASQWPEEKVQQALATVAFQE